MIHAMQSAFTYNCSSLDSGGPAKISLKWKKKIQYLKFLRVYEDVKDSNEITNIKKRYLCARRKYIIFNKKKIILSILHLCNYTIPFKLFVSISEFINMKGV